MNRFPFHPLLIKDTQAYPGKRLRSVHQETISNLRQQAACTFIRRSNDEHLTGQFPDLEEMWFPFERSPAITRPVEFGAQASKSQKRGSYIEL